MYKNQIYKITHTYIGYPGKIARNTSEVIRDSKRRKQSYTNISRFRVIATFMLKKS